MASPLCIFELPDPDKAPGYRDSLASRSHFEVEDFGERLVAVKPAEGAGGTAQHFAVHLLADAQADLANDDTWEPLRRFPPRRRGVEDPAAYRKAMIDRANEILQRNPDRAEAQVTAFALQAFGAAEAGDLEELLAAQLPYLFEGFPHGQLLYVTVADALLARLAFGRAQFAFQMTPDMPVGPDMDQLKALEEMTLMRGVDSTAVMNIPLLVFSPAVLGFVIPALPHSLVFCFGDGLDLRRPHPHSLPSIYRPKVFNDPLGIDRLELLRGLDAGDGPVLLEWWIERLNRLYSHATDPTRWTDDEMRHDPSAQAAWLITLERLIGDTNSLLSEPQATELDRAQIAFDLLDKAEGLLGYERNRTGKGFEALLRRRACLRRLNDAFASMPGDTGERLARDAETLFAGMYDEVRENTVSFRRTQGGAKIARDDATNLQSIDDETLVSTLMRAIRNSSHGLLDILRTSNDRFLLAANSCGVRPNSRRSPH